jgi:outer membrane protein assembly factor BamB
VHLALSLLLPLAALGLAPDNNTDWPQWRGPNRDGIVRASRLPAKWPEALPAPKWQANVGIGYSGPVVSKGRVFIQGREGGNETCVALDAETGKEVWKVTYPSAFEPPDPTAGKGPNATPTVDRDRVYMLGLGGMLHCLEAATGKVLWKHDLDKEYWGVEKDNAFGEAWRPPCGTAASPLVMGNQVIVAVGGKKAGAFTGFDRETGKLLWKALDDRSSYASPILVDLAGQKQIVGFTGKRMVGLSAADRKLLWEVPFTAMYEQTIITPVVWKDRVIIGGEAKPTFAVQLSSSGGTLKSEEVWKNAELSAYLVTPVVVKDHLYGFDQRSRRITCVELASGKTAWTSPRIGRMFVSLLAHGDQVLALTDQGELHVISSDPSAFKSLHTWKVAESGTIWSQLAVVGDRLFIKDKEHLSCYSIHNAPKQ